MAPTALGQQVAGTEQLEDLLHAQDRTLHERPGVTGTEYRAAHGEHAHHHLGGIGDQLRILGHEGGYAVQQFGQFHRGVADRGQQRRTKGLGQVVHGDLRALDLLRVSLHGIGVSRIGGSGRAIERLVADPGVLVPVLDHRADEVLRLCIAEQLADLLLIAGRGLDDGLHRSVERVATAALRVADDLAQVEAESLLGLGLELGRHDRCHEALHLGG
ncbi:hypothetical protein G6F35_015445 [Rhizopus arrhizus]|nr:hypothetical protein G6F35_015445 [Rhizopus arrhizus]